MKRYVLITSFVAVSSAVFAHGGATGIIKERMDGMEVLKDAFKQAREFTKPDVAFDADALQKSARILSAEAARIAPLFKEKDISMPSEAKAEIWDEFDKFTQLATDLETAANALAGVTTQEDLRTAARDVGVTCSACHKLYREKKK